MRKDSAAPISETFSIVNAEDRLFKIWATVEVYDTQGQRVPIEIFKGVVPKLLTRTVPFHLEHTNKAVGEVVNYEFGTHPEFNAPGCLVTGKIYRGFQLDDEAWRGLQELALMASIGGQSSSNKPGDLEWVAPCEIALTKKGANPGAKVVEVAAMAKSDYSEKKLDARAKELKAEGKTFTEAKKILMAEFGVDEPTAAGSLAVIGMAKSDDMKKGEEAISAQDIFTKEEWEEAKRSNAFIQQRLQRKFGAKANFVETDSSNYSHATIYFTMKKSDDMKKGQYFIKWRGREYFTDADNRVHAWERFWTHNIVEDEKAFKRETSYKDVMEKSDVSERAKAKSELKKEEMSDEYANEMAWRLFRKHWNGLSSQQQDKIQEEWDAQKSDVSERAKESKEHPELPKETIDKIVEDRGKLGKADMEKPFAGYKDFAGCVAANKDKEDPKAYCATIMRSVEGEKMGKYASMMKAIMLKGKISPAEEGEIGVVIDELREEGLSTQEIKKLIAPQFHYLIKSMENGEDKMEKKMGKSEMEKATVTVTDEKKEPPAAQAQEAKEGKEEHAPEQKSDTPPAEVPREKAPEAREAPKPDAPDFESRLASIESNMQKVLEFMQKATEASAAAAPVKETAPVKEEKPAEAVKPEAPAKPEEPKTPESAKAEEKPKEKTEEEKKEDMGKAAVADMQKSAEPASTPRPPVNEMPFNPEKHAGKNTKLPTPAEIMKGAKLDTLDFVKEYFTKPGALRS